MPSITSGCFGRLRRSPSSKKDFKKFIQVRNDFHEALSQLNEALYATKNAVMLPELLDLQEWLDS